jgi:hypothetical protein
MIQQLKQSIWDLSGRNLDIVNAAKAKVTIEPDTVAFWEAVGREVEQLVKPIKHKPRTNLTKQHKERYRAAKLAYQTLTDPEWIKAGHFIEPNYPNTSTSNGLTRFIVDYITWSGYRATRITTEGRAIIKNGKAIRIPTQTRRGTADISATINGKSIMIEIKVGSDKPSPFQLEEQQRERKAGGIYEFISTPDEFFLLFDRVKGLF